MSVASVVTGTQTCVISTEHALYNPSPATAGVFQLVIDAVNLAAGDVLEVRGKQMVLTGGTTRVAYMTTYYGAQQTDNLIFISVPITNELTDNGAVQFSIKQTFGVGRNIPYKVLKIA